MFDTISFLWFSPFCPPNREPRYSLRRTGDNPREDASGSVGSFQSHLGWGKGRGRSSSCWYLVVELINLLLGKNLLTELLLLLGLNLWLCLCLEILVLLLLLGLNLWLSLCLEILYLVILLAPAGLTLARKSALPGPALIDPVESWT